MNVTLKVVVKCTLQLYHCGVTKRNTKASVKLVPTVARLIRTHMGTSVKLAETTKRKFFDQVNT